MALTNPSLPGIRQPLLEGNAASRPYYLFLQWMATNLPAVAAQVDALTYRVDSITGGGSGEASNITGKYSIRTYGSLGAGIVQISLEGDTAEPGNTQYYGSDTTGTKGWFPVASALSGSTNVDLATGADGVTTFDLTDLANSGAGTLLAITRDSKGRITGTRDATITGTAARITVANGDAVAGRPTLDLATVADVGGGALLRFVRDVWGRITGTSSATTSDLTEGSNLYYTDARADARITAQKGVANGVAPLGSDGKVSASYLPAAVLGQVSYQGTWDASAGTPPTTTPNKGWYYIVTVGGSTNLDGITDWQVGDWAIYNGSAWNKVDNTDAVSSVAGLTGVILTASLQSALGLGTAAYTPSGNYATAAQGAKADTAVQPSGSITGNAGTATKLATSRTLTVGATARSFDGTANISWSLADIGADAAGAAASALSSANAYTDSGLAGKEPTIAAGTTAQYRRGDKSWQTLDASAVGLGNVNNTSDTAKPVSTAQAAADSLRVLKSGDTMNGPLVLPSDPTLALQAATKQYTDARAANPSPISKTAAAEVFLTAAGGETSAPLTIGGVALVGTPTVTAIHSTDWQGRQLLYSTARSNYQRQTEALNNTSYWSASNVTVTASSTQVGGSGPAYWTVQRTASSGSALSSLQPSAATGSVGSTSIFRVWLRAGTVSSCDIGMVGAGTPSSYACTAAIISGPGSISAGGNAFAPHISGLSTTQDTCVELSRIKPATDTGAATCYIYPGNTSGNTGDSVLVAAPNFFNVQSGSYIPATTAAVTVTDYTLSGSTVSFGQSATAGAVYDWDGSGTPRYPASFAGPVTVGQYLKAALPSASTYTYALIVVTDATGGPALCLSNGTNWINLTTGSVVS